MSMAKKKKKIGQVPPQVKRLRAARRKVAIELQTPVEHSHIFETSIKDAAAKLPKTLRLDELEG